MEDWRTTYLTDAYKRAIAKMERYDQIIYENHETGVRAIVGVRPRPLPEQKLQLRNLSFKLGAPDYYLIIEKPIKMPRRDLSHDLKKIQKEVEKEKLFPEGPEIESLMREQNAAIRSSDFERLKPIGEKVEKLYASSTVVIAKQDWKKRGQKKMPRTIALHKWIERRVHAYKLKGHGNNSACDLVQDDLGKGSFRSQPQIRSVSTIARIAKVKIRKNGVNYRRVTHFPPSNLLAK